MIKPRVVFDTNIYLSAFVFSGLPRKVLNLAIKDKINLFVSPAILLEIAEKLKNKFLWSEEKVQKVIKVIADTAFVVKPRTKLKVIKKDPTDNKILEAALAGKADIIISGDKHLLNIKKYKNIKIIKAREFFDIFSSGKRHG